MFRNRVLAKKILFNVRKLKMEANITLDSPIPSNLNDLLSYMFKKLLLLEISVCYQI